jgi:hypothetical protein
MPGLSRASTFLVVLASLDGRDEPGHGSAPGEIGAGYALKIVNPRISSTRKITTKT